MTPEAASSSGSRSSQPRLAIVVLLLVALFAGLSAAGLTETTRATAAVSGTAATARTTGGAVAFNSSCDQACPSGPSYTASAVRPGAASALTRDWLLPIELGVVSSRNAAEGLSPEIDALSEAHVTDSGTTVLGRFLVYIAKAQSLGASYFDIGDAWNSLSPAEQTAANNHFLDVIAGRGDRVLLSVPKGEVPTTGPLADEIAYLTDEKGYVWVNQWSLRPGG